LYRYIYTCIDTNVLKLVQADYHAFVSIHSTFVSIQIALIGVRGASVFRNTLVCFETHVDSLETRESLVFRNILLCFETYQSRLCFTGVCIDTMSWLYRYIHTKLQFFQRCQLLVSIHSNECIDTSLLDCA
jgi:hypothetical protein